MCRNIKTLFNFEPPATQEEIRASAIQFVRKLGGFNKPSQPNEAAFTAAIEQVNSAAATLIASLTTTAPHKNREEEKAKLMALSQNRFGPGNVRNGGAEPLNPSEA